MQTILFILQNAYKSEKYNFKNEDEWYSDLMQSCTGKRLSEMIPIKADVKVINASSKIGKSANSCFEADTKYLSKMIKNINPKIICACGKVATLGCKKLGLDFIELPHPAWRQLSKARTQEIRQGLEVLIK